MTWWRGGVHPRGRGDNLRRSGSRGAKEEEEEEESRDRVVEVVAILVRGRSLKRTRIESGGKEKPKRRRILWCLTLAQNIAVFPFLIPTMSSLPLFVCFLLALPPSFAVHPHPNFRLSGGPQIIRQAFDRPVPPPNTKHLTARPASPFKIALFSDLHFGENAWSDWGPRQDVNSVRVMSVVLDRELPDFVVYLGDVVTANNFPVANASSYWDQAVSPTRSRGIPFASVFGNHDDAAFQWPMEWFSSPGIPPVQCPASSSPIPGEEECSFKGTARLQLMKAEMEKNTLSYSRSGPKELWPSVSNFVLPISLNNNSQSPIAYLYFLDSGGGSYPEVISKSQVLWFRRKSQEINPDSSVPELIFWHIPSKAYAVVAPWWAIWNPCVGSINKEKVTPQDSEEGMMELLEKRPSVKAIFVGHDHGLDWCCPYKKLWLCYARHTGYGGYGNWARGARIIEINEDPFGIKSWIRMENGDVHSEVVLND